MAAKRYCHGTRGTHPGPGAGGVLTSVLALLLLAAPVRAQFSVDPVILEFASDTASTATVHVKNQGSGEMQLRFYTADFDQTLSGDHDFLPIGRHPRTCAARLSVYPDGATLRPGEQQDIRVSMAPGTRTCWSLVFVESRTRAPTGMSVGQRIGVKVYGVPPTAMLDGQVDTVSVVPGGSALTVHVRFTNRGEAPLRPQGRVEIRSFAGKVLESVDVDAFSVLPEHSRELALPVGGRLPPGQYLAVPILDFGADYLAGGQAVFRIP